ncbi:MAG: isoprenylcysteine carboxylmethyltransferase family protein [Pseudomonadota bacterium]
MQKPIAGGPQPSASPDGDALRRRAVALAYGGGCHAVFGLGVGAMMLAMFFGMSRSLGPFEGPWRWLANAALIAQFAVGHSWLLTAQGRRLLRRLAPEPYGETLATTTYATIAAAQVGLLFAFWSPSGVVWWAAEGWALYALTGAYLLAWALLMKSMLDAGIELQSGLLGWRALFLGRKPRFPDMPTTGLFRYTRQPIYLTFTLTLWTPPVWTPDQLALAVGLTGYCLIGPLFKERRFERMFGDRFEAYRARTPYWLPIPKRPAARPPRS